MKWRLGRFFRRSCDVAVNWSAKRCRWFWNAWCEDFVCVEKNHLWCHEGSEKLQTVFETYNQELNRGQVAPTYQKLRKKWGNILIRRQGHAISKPERNEDGDGSVGQKSQGKKCQRWKWEMDSSKWDSWSFNQGSHSGQGAHSFSSSKAATQTEGRKPWIFRSSRGASPSGLKGREGPFQNFLKGKCTESPRDLWHPPVCLNYKSVSGCKYGDKCHFRHTDAGGQPNKSQRKVAGKDSGIVKRDHTIGLCVPW